VVSKESIFGIYGKPSRAATSIRKALKGKMPEKYKFTYPKVPYPDDDETLRELNELVELSKTERVQHIAFIEMADENLLDCFTFFLEENDLEYTPDMGKSIGKILAESSILIIKLKYWYNRPRPYQVAEIADIDFEPLDSETAKTPSYPSGHVVQSKLIAEFLSEVYPQYIDEFYALADKISYSRMWGGFHFKSDILFGEKIFDIIKSNIKDDNMNKRDDFVCISTTELSSGNKEYKMKGKARTWFMMDNMQLQENENTLDEVKTYSVSGIASSTSVDTYGTEMSIEALRSMSRQFNRGLPVLPRHSSTLSAGIAEWDEVIGRTFEAEIKRTKVVNPKNEQENQFSLFVRSELYSDDPKAKDLIKRMNRGEPIGQSIGGWFENIRVMENEEGEIQRVIVDDVVLDHVAITRAPSNPDSTSLMMMSIRTSIDKFHKDNIECRSEKHTPQRERDMTATLDRFEDEDEEEKEKHEEGAVKDDEEHVEDLEIDEAEDEDDDEKSRMKKEMAMLKEENDRMKKELEKADSKEDLADEADEEDLVPDSEKARIAERKAIPYHELSKAPVDEKWSFTTVDGDKVLGPDDDWGKYKKAHLWYDEKRADTKGGYKLPIAKLYNGKLSVFFRGVVAAMAAINGARGGVDIPDSDRRSVYTALKKYYKQFGETAPDLRSECSSGKTITQNMDKQFDNSVQSLNYNDRDNENITSNIMENPMTENDLQKLAELISTSVRTATTHASTPEVPVKTEVERLKERLERTENMLNRYLEEPKRSGVHHLQIRAGFGAKNEFSEIIERSRKAGAVSLSKIVERNVDALSEEGGPAKLSVGQVRDLLMKGLRAAQVDGLI